MPTRKTALTRFASLTSLLLWDPLGANAFAASNSKQPSFAAAPSNDVAPTSVAYRSMQVDVTGTRVPVAMWFPINSDTQQPTTTYQHNISVKRIGQLLAGWDFIPDFASKQFALPSTAVDGTNIAPPTKSPVVLLAHGYLGSRFDLSHLAEALAREGFVCVSAEYPESLAASYERREDLDRAAITSQLLKDLESSWGIQSTGFGIVGHSLGTGTALSTGDASWARVCIAGFPRKRDGSAATAGNALFVCSMNDGTVSFSGFGGKESIPRDFSILNEADALPEKLPSRATILFDRPDGPNHISFLTDGVNEAMIDLLSPLLPVAQALSIPVLDFDKYKVSRDSKETAEIVIPLVTKYLKQEMKVV